MLLITLSKLGVIISMFIKSKYKIISTLALICLIFSACLSSPEDNTKVATENTLPTSSKTNTVPTISPSSINTSELPKDIPPELRIIWESWQFLQEDYVDKSKLDPITLSEAAVKAMVEAVGDKETNYIAPDTLSGRFDDIYRGDFEGIGAYVTMNAAGKIQIVSPIEGSPAQAAGIKPGDTILEVDGKSVEGMSVLEVISLVRGPKNTEVKILIKRLGSPKRIEVSIIRGTIPLTSVYVRSKEDDPLLHIRISDFYPNTVDQLKKVLIESEKKGITKGIILDLRNNPGGTINATVDVADQFLPENILLYSMSGDGRRSQSKTTNDGLAINIPMVVLVNKGSASASEVLAGAIQDYNRAPLIGETTYGKGAVNILRRLSNDGGLYITWALWYTPSGRMINNTGLEPNIVVTDQDTKEAERKQLERAQSELRKIIELSNESN